MFVLRIFVRVFEQLRVVAVPQEAGPGGHEGHVDAEPLEGHVSRNCFRRKNIRIEIILARL